MKNVLVVGGAGYVGGAVTDIISNSNHNIKVYDSLLYEDRYMKDVPFVRGDVRDSDKLKKELKWADTVIWLAAIVGDGACQVDPKLAREINVSAVKWLCDNFDGRIIFPSSCSVYGVGQEALNENARLKPLSLYAMTKVDAERLLAEKNAIVFRLGTLFGISDKFSRIRFDLVLNLLTMRAVIDKHITVFGGEQYRPLLHVRDAAHMLARAVYNEKCGIFNLCHTNIKIIELAEKVKGAIPDCEIEIADAESEDTRDYRVSSRKARKLGFWPIHYPEIGIDEIAELIVSKRIKDPMSHLYSNSAYLGRIKWTQFNLERSEM